MSVAVAPAPANVGDRWGGEDKRHDCGDNVINVYGTVINAKYNKYNIFFPLKYLFYFKKIAYCDFSVSENHKFLQL